MGGFTNAIIYPQVAAAGGSSVEALERVRYAATKSFASNNRGVTKDDIIEGDKAAGSYDKIMVADFCLSLSRKKEGSKVVDDNGEPLLVYHNSMQNNMEEFKGYVSYFTDNNYNGVGLELYADRDNYFRYRTNPSELVVKTKSFYFGSSSQYISGSNGSIAISSSNFYLDPSGNVTLSGVVNITGGSGFATPASVSASINTATGSLSASLNTTINANSSSAASALSSVSSSTADRIVTDAANKIVKPNDTPGGGAGLYLSQKYLGYYNASAWNAYISSSGEFLFKKDADNLISFGNNAFTLKVSDAATISGSNINLITPNFFFGNNTQFISGSGGNLQISSSNFSVSANGSVTASNALFSGVNTSNIIRRKSVTITTANSSSYLQTTFDGDPSTVPYYQLFLDGTYGGEKVQYAIISCSLARGSWTDLNTSVTYTGVIPIGSIIFPEVSAGQSAECFIEIATGAVVYISTDVGSFRGYSSIQQSPPDGGWESLPPEAGGF